MQNGVVESFNGLLRDECLKAHWFRTLHDARGKIERWRTDYNHDRPHSSLRYRTPEQFEGLSRAASQWSAGVRKGRQTPVRLAIPPSLQDRTADEEGGAYYTGGSDPPPGDRLDLQLRSPHEGISEEKGRSGP